MILLRNFDFINEYFDIETERICGIKNISKINGWYKSINGNISGLLVLNYKLYFIWKTDKYIVTNNYNVKLTPISVSNQKEFKLYDLDSLILGFTYKIEPSYSDVSPFEYIEDNDFDWGNFIAGIINNKEKQQVFIENIMED